MSQSNNKNRSATAPKVWDIIKGINVGTPLSRQQIKLIESNAVLLIQFKPRDYCWKSAPTVRQELMIEQAAEALVAEYVVDPIDAGHALTTIGYAMLNPDYFTEANNRFLPKLLMIQQAIRTRGLWEIWQLVKINNEVTV